MVGQPNMIVTNKATLVGERVKPQCSIDWGMAQVTLAGQTISGDRLLVREHPDGVVVAVVDGLGHGAEAAVAANVAIATLEAYILEPVTLLLKRCHEAMRRTRGAAMSLASFNGVADSMTWLGVGNVDAVVLRADKHAIPARENIRLFPGVVGYHLPSVRAVVTALSPGDIVIFYTDGIQAEFLSESYVGQSPRLIAGGICRNHCKGTDDALVLVVRIRERPLSAER